MCRPGKIAIRARGAVDFLRAGPAHSAIRWCVRGYPLKVVRDFLSEQIGCHWTWRHAAKFSNRVWANPGSSRIATPFFTQLSGAGRFHCELCVR